jgi:hypothetical protein
MSATEDTVDEFLKAISTFKSMKDSLDANFTNGLKEIFTIKELSDQLGKYLHDLRRNKPNEDILQQIIAVAPTCLSYTNEKGRLPIHTAARYTGSARYVPLLAKEGIKFKVGGGSKRGGLLVKVTGKDYGTNALQMLANLSSRTNTIPTDTTYLDVMKELRDSNLLLKEDIKDHNLLLYACCRNSQLRFDFLVDWDAKGLLTYKFKGLPIVLATVKYFPTHDRLSAFLETALRLHPGDLGGFFLKDKEGKTVCERAFAKYGIEKTMKILGNLIPFEDPHFPILHHVAKHAPQYMNDFVNRYPSAIYLRDCKGRTLHQDALASGSKKFKSHAMFFVGMSDDQVREIDPVTELYPFMVAASGQMSDLDAVYYLMKKDPSLAKT